MSEVISTKYGSVENTYQNSSNDVSTASSTENSSVQQNHETKLTSCITNHFLKHRLEIFTFLFTFSYVLTDVTSTTMILDKVCLVHFGYNSSICNDLENHTGIKSSVEKLATNYQLAHHLIQTAPAAVLACFIGPWSDQYGRKIPVVIALVGILMDSIGSIACAYFLETRVEYFFIPAIFTGLFGGSVSIMAVIYSYGSDGSTLRERTMKYAFIEMAVGFATSFGSSAGGWIFKGLGFAPVFLFAAGGLCFSLVFVIFLIQETRGLSNHELWTEKIKKLFSCKTFSECFTAIAKPRQHQGRKQVVLLILSMCFLVIAMKSTTDINYLYAHHQFGWDTTTYSNIVSIYSIIGIAVLVVVIPVLKYFQVTETSLGLLGTASLFGKSLGVGLSRKENFYHVACVTGLLGGCSTFAARSRISKVARDDDLGKMFTFVATAESLLPILTSILQLDDFLTQNQL